MKNSKEYISKLNLTDQKIWEDSWTYVKTDLMTIVETLVEHMNSIEAHFKERTDKLEINIKELEKKLKKAKK